MIVNFQYYVTVTQQLLFFSFFLGARVEARASCMLSTCSTISYTLHPPPSANIL